MSRIYSHAVSTLDDNSQTPPDAALPTLLASGGVSASERLAREQAEMRERNGEPDDLVEDNLYTDELLTGVKGHRGYLQRVRIFILEYCRTHDAAKSYRVAYPNTTSSAGQNAYALIRRPGVSEAIERELEKRRRAYIVDEGTLVRNIAELANGNMQDFSRVGPDGTAWIDLSSLTRAQWGCIQEIYTEEVVEGRDENGRTIRKTKIKLYDKQKANELLMKKAGYLKDKMELVGEDDGPAVVRLQLVRPGDAL